MATIAVKRPALLALAGILLGCALGCRSGGRVADPLPRRPEVLPAPATLEAGAALQRQLLDEADGVAAELSALRRSGGWQQRGYFTASEHDAMDALLFRFVVDHAALWGQIDRNGPPQPAGVPDEQRLGARVLALHAGLVVADSSAFLVAEFDDDPVALAVLNESIFRYEIPAGSYDRLRLAVTSPDRLDLLATAWQLHEQDLERSGAALDALSSAHPSFAALLADLPGLQRRAVSRTREALAGSGGGLDAHLSHSPLADLARAGRRELGVADEAARARLFTDVSRIKSPTAHRIVFSPAQKRRIHELLRPGDVILTYTAGYVSDVFIPGEFKHGITYVGDAEERANAGLGRVALPGYAAAEVARLRANLERDELPGGLRADLIEGVAEGVRFSNLDRILDTHVNRMLVLRPRLGEIESVEFLLGVFSYLGDPYDFRFDFADASRQVCTEVIYRALDRRGGIHFELVERLGRPTLSADDIVAHHLGTRGEHFETILFAEEDPAAEDHRARILLGADAHQRVEERMATEVSP